MNGQMNRFDVLLNLRNEALVKIVVTEVRQAIMQAEQSVSTELNPNVATALSQLTAEIQTHKRNLRIIELMMNGETKTPVTNRITN